MQRIRTFIAITPPQEVKGEIKRIITRLGRKNHLVCWEDTEKAHITLAFLGNIPQARMEEAAKAVEETSRNFPKFILQTDSISYFYKDRSGNESIIFLSIYDPAKNLRQLHKLLARNLTEHEFSPSTHFSAHITIGRLKKQRHPYAQKRLLAQIADIDVPRGHEFEVGHLNVYESMPQGNSHRHHLLKSCEFLG